MEVHQINLGLVLFVDSQPKHHHLGQGGQILVVHYLPDGWFEPFVCHSVELFLRHIWNWVLEELNIEQLLEFDLVVDLLSCQCYFNGLKFVQMMEVGEVLRRYVESL